MILWYKAGTQLQLVWAERSIYGSAFEDEFSLEAFNLYGALSMANAGPNTNGSQFFIVQMKEVPENMLSQLADGGWPQPIVEAYGEKGGTPWLDQNIQYLVNLLRVNQL